MLTAKFPWQIKPIAKIRSTVAFVPDLYFLQQSQSQEPPRSFALFIVFSHKFWSANLNRISILQLTFLWREAKSDPAKYLYFICTSFFILSKHSTRQPSLARGAWFCCDGGSDGQMRPPGLLNFFRVCEMGIFGEKLFFFWNDGGTWIALLGCSLLRPKLF